MCQNEETGRILVLFTVMQRMLHKISTNGPKNSLHGHEIVTALIKLAFVQRGRLSHHRLLSSKLGLTKPNEHGLSFNAETLGLTQQSGDN